MPDYAIGSTIDAKFSTAVNGTPTALSGGTVVAYPTNSTTEITAGITLTADFDSRTGLNHVRVVATSGNGYSAGDYQLVLSAGTVGGVSVVGRVVAEFGLEATMLAAVKAKTDNLPEGIKKNTALSNFEFFLASSSDHVTAATGLTVTATRSIDGGAFASCTNSVSEVGSGVYKIDLAAADVNGTVVTLLFVAAGADALAITVKTCL